MQFNYAKYKSLLWAYFYRFNNGILGTSEHISYIRLLYLCGI